MCGLLPESSRVVVFSQYKAGGYIDINLQWLLDWNSDKHALKPDSTPPGKKIQLNLSLSLLILHRIPAYIFYLSNTHFFEPPIHLYYLRVTLSPWTIVYILHSHKLILDTLTISTDYTIATTYSHRTTNIKFINLYRLSLLMFFSRSLFLLKFPMYIYLLHLQQSYIK